MQIKTAFQRRCERLPLELRACLAELLWRGDEVAYLGLLADVKAELAKARDAIGEVITTKGGTVPGENTKLQ